MKIQNSRNSLQPDKDYSAVCHQQGRMLTDSDLTEQALIARDKLSHALRDVIGSGTPRHDGMLNIDELGVVSLHWGRVYVDGILAEVRPDTGSALVNSMFDYARQLYFPQAPDLPSSGSYRYYLDVWHRTITWLNDETLRDPGLHGADTTTRTQTVAQVKWCADGINPLDATVNPTIGNALLSLTLRSKSSTSDPCDPCAEELELHDPVGNYLFRVEVHDVEYDTDNSPSAVVLKWSSENGAEAYHASDVPPDFVDPKYAYEFFSNVTELQLGRHVTTSTIEGERQPLVNSFDNTGLVHADFVRRWDGWCKLVKSDEGWELGGITDTDNGILLSTETVGGRAVNVEIENGEITINLNVITMKLELTDGASNYTLLAGDYWTAPVRESIHQQGDVLLGEIITSDPTADESSIKGIPPQGEQHHYMLLVDVDTTGTILNLPPSEDQCKPQQFPSLTDLHAADICYANSCEKLYGEATTVKEALDNLCDIEASDINFSSTCDVINSATNVANALELLCNAPKPGGGCAHTVGEGGEFETLEEALKALSGTDAVICLPAGEYVIESPEDWEFNSLKIVGSGATSTKISIRDHVETLSIGSRELIFRDLTFEVENVKGQIRLISSRVDVQSCTFDQSASENENSTVVVSVLSKDIGCDITWVNNKMTSKSHCLGLSSPLVTGTIRDNYFAGALILNESAEEGTNLGDDSLIALSSQANPSAIDQEAAGSLSIINNEMSRVVTMIPNSMLDDSTSPVLTTPMTTWRSLFIGNNTIHLRQNGFAAWSVNMQGNHFDVNVRSSAMHLGLVLGSLATLTGNISPHDDFTLRAVLSNIHDLASIQSANVMTIY